MKTVIELLWVCKRNVIYWWIFLFLLALSGKTPHSILYLFLISGLCSIFINAIVIILIKYTYS